MFKRAVFFSLVFGLITIHASASAVVEEMDYSRVQGKVSFEKRSTIVPLNDPMSICSDNQPCVKPRPYWTVVVSSRKSRFELDQTFALGSERAPEAIEVSGLVIRQGSQVAVEGRVQHVTPNYAIVSDVRSVELVLDSRLRPAVASIRPSIDSTAPVDSSWMCRSEIGLEAEFQTHVWFESVRGVEQFKMAILSRSDEGLKELARINDLGFSSERNNLIYKGATGGISAELAIHQFEEAFFDLPGVLKLTKARRTIMDVNRLAPGADAQVAVKCSRMNVYFE